MWLSSYLQAITSEDVALHGILRGQSSPNRTPNGSLQSLDGQQADQRRRINRINA